MKRRYRLTLSLACSLAGMFFVPSGAAAPQRGGVQLELRSAPWTFRADAAPDGTLTRRYPQGSFVASCDTSFSVRFTVRPKAFHGEVVILEIPRVLKVVLREHDPADRSGQNYPAFKMPDGSVPVLEATLDLTLPMENGAERRMPVGIPLAALDNPRGVHDVVLDFCGIRWSLYVDGELQDNDFPLGYPSLGRTVSWRMDPRYVTTAGLYCPGLKARSRALKHPRVKRGIDGWTPEGHNAWVGDVATCYHDGRYHLFYLYDRRGHGSKFGRGGHYFEHLSTADFKTWTEHPAAVPIEHPWETIATGVPFVWDGRLCLSYGLHTTRIHPAEKTTLPLLRDFYDRTGATRPFRYDTVPDRFPAGATYAVSEDGIHFRKSRVLFHFCENPSIYTDPEGRLRMLANYGASGTWQSDSLHGDWRPVDPVFPPGGDCTFYFHRDGYDYIVGGFSGMWSKPADSPDGYRDLVAQGLDFYNGLSVPAVTQIGDGRFLMAGWLKLVHWGGSLHIHEVVPLTGGRLGTRWMEELLPPTGKSVALDPHPDESRACPSESFLLTFEVHPGKARPGKLGVVFLPQQGESDACELSIDLSERRAQYGPGSRSGFAAAEKTLREGGVPHDARNYAIENLVDTDAPFTVRMIVRYDEKWGGCILDTELARKRTLLSFRPGLKVGRMLFRSENLEIRSVRIAALSD